MSNSPLVSYTLLSPNNGGIRKHKIDTVTIHCTAGKATVESLGALFAQTSTAASANYGIGYDGKVGMYVEEGKRSWCSSNTDNDDRAVTIEVSTTNVAPYVATQESYDTLIKLLVDICQRNDIKELKWQADKSLIGQIDKQNMTVHRWFANKACPGDYLYGLHGKIAAEVNAILSADKVDNTAQEIYKKLMQYTQSQVESTQSKSTGAYARAKARGLLNGNAPKNFVTYEQLCLILKRLGVLQ